MRVGDNGGAEEEFRKDIALEPEIPDNFEQLGALYLGAGQDAEAAMAFGEALQRNANMPASHYGLAKIYLMRERYREAVQQADAALRLALNSQSYHYLRANALLKMGRREEAKAEFATVQKIMDAGLGKRRESLGDDNRLPNPELRQQPQ